MTASDDGANAPRPEGDRTERPPTGARASYISRNSFAAQAGEGVSGELAPTRTRAGESVPRQGAQDRVGSAERGQTQEERGEAERPARYRTRLRTPVLRHHVRSVRLNDDELAQIHRAATAARLTDAGFIATAAVTLATAPGDIRAWLADRRELVEELMAATAHLARVGNNLNQVARALNSGGDAPYVDEVLRLVARATARVEQAAQEMVRR
jgi:hypothetical protein